MGLLCAIPTLLLIYSESRCTEYDDEMTFFIFAFSGHLANAIFSFLSQAAKNFKFYEFGKFMDLLRIPIYLYIVMNCQLIQLNDQLTGDHAKDDFCQSKGKVRFKEAWVHIEIPIYYMYIMTGVIYLFLNHFLTVNPVHIDENSHKHITFGKGDFLERHKKPQNDFSLYSFEILITIYIIVEELIINPDHDLGEFAIPMIVELTANCLSLMIASTVFLKLQIKTEHWLRTILLVLRLGCQIIALYMVFGLKSDNYQIVQGFWIVVETYIFIFVLLNQLFQHCIADKYEDIDRLADQSTSDYGSNLSVDTNALAKTATLKAIEK